ncbi:MAG: DUF951 domain-containing protein [Chloroflexota bacterium]|nr:DUF951 domain-containing protein [Chloroflexota bacterium]
MLPDLGFGDIIRMRKPHPCGGYEWRVVRMGADIGLECLTCGRRILLERRALKNRLKTIISKGSEADEDNG